MTAITKLLEFKSFKLISLLSNFCGCKLANAEQYSNSQLKTSIAQLISYANRGQKPQKMDFYSGILK